MEFAVRQLLLTLALGIVFPASMNGAVRGEEVLYLGGTISAIPEYQKGILDTSGDTTLVFRWDKGQWGVPYERIRRMEYGRKVGRRVAAAVAATAVTPVGPVFLISKKKKHFLSLEIEDETGETGAAVFELSKKNYEGIIADLETKTGLQLEYQPTEHKRGKKGGGR